MASLVNAYMDVSNKNVPFEQIFTDYDFNSYIDTDVANHAMIDTYYNSIEQINFNSEMSWDTYADLHSYEVLTNDSYTEFLHDSIDYFNAIGDYNSALYCEQQLHILDYCQNYDVNFYNTFYDL